MKKISTLLILTILIFLIVGLPEIFAQCPMCRMSAETNLEQGGSMGKGLNNGILYILSLPYLLVLSLGIIWYRNKRKNENDSVVEE